MFVPALTMFLNSHLNMNIIQLPTGFDKIHIPVQKEFNNLYLTYDDTLQFLS